MAIVSWDQSCRLPVQEVKLRPHFQCQFPIICAVFGKNKKADLVSGTPLADTHRLHHPCSVPTPPLQVHGREEVGTQRARAEKKQVDSQVQREVRVATESSAEEGRMCGVKKHKKSSTGGRRAGDSNPTT
jgi:hypothetical protein